MAKVTYKQRLKAASELKSTGLSQLHERVTLLVTVFEDRDFRADIGGDDFAVASALDKYVDDCALTFLELRAVLQTFPATDAWSSKPLRELYADAVSKSRPAAEETTERQPRRTASVKQVETLEAAVKEKEFQVKTLATELDELRQDNRRLLSENARLEGRIVELERLIERSGAVRSAGSAR